MKEYERLCAPNISTKRKIFISYRREETAFQTSSIYIALTSYFGRNKVFKDDESIPDGVNFVDFINHVLSECSVLICVIGENWLNTHDTKGYRRLDHTSDFVRVELEIALRRRIPIIPVLIDNAQMPNELELPDTLRGLSYFSARKIRSGSDFSSDLIKLIKGVKENIYKHHKLSFIKAVNDIMYFNKFSIRFWLNLSIITLLSLLIISKTDWGTRMPIIPSQLNREREIRKERINPPKNITVLLVKVEDFLKQKKYIAASNETNTAILRVLRKQGSSDLLREDIDNIPCSFLIALDTLWNIYSNNKFSFSTQRKIYKDTGNILNGKFNEEYYEKFADAVGFRRNGKYINEQDLMDSDLAPDGHLPGTPFWGENNQGRTGYFAYYLEKTCKM